MANASPLQATLGHEHEHEAVTQARQRLETVRNLHGENHPDFATGLNHLALLLIMHDAPDEAEPLLHQALAIRKVVLGEDHPDYATCLSSLGGLLWARGDLEAAEPLLHQAHEIRCRILGVDHPRSLASQSCLEQFLRMKSEQHDKEEHLEATQAPSPGAVVVPAPAAVALPGAWEPESEPEDEVEQPTQPERDAITDATGQDRGEKFETVTESESEIEAEVEEHAQPSRDDARSHSMSMSSNELSHELVVLTDVFTDLSERLMEAAHQLQTPGLPPSDELVAELSSCQREYANIRDRTLTLGESLYVVCPPVERLKSLEDLTTFLNVIAEAELLQANSEEIRHRSMSVLDRVLMMTHTSDAGFAPLHACQETARTLHEAISHGSWDALPAEAEALAEGEHPLAHLLMLIEGSDELDDELWSELHASVSSSFGKSLATAVARARIVLPFEHVGATSEEQ